MNAGTKVRFTQDTTTENYYGKEVHVPAGSVGRVVSVISSEALYVKVNGRKVVAFTSEVEVVVK